MPGNISTDFIDETLKKLKQSLKEIKKYTSSTSRMELINRRNIEEHINAVAKLINARNKLNASMRANERLLNKLKDAAAKERKAVEAAKDKLASAKTDAARQLATKELEDITRKYNNSLKVLAETRGRLNKRIVKSLTLREKLSNKINEHRKAIKKLQEAGREENKRLMEWNKRLTIAAQKIVTYRIAFGVYREITNTIGNVTDETIRLNDVFQDLRKVLDVNEDGFNRLRKAAFNYGIIFGRTAEDVASSFRVFAQQGLTLEEVLDRTRAVMLLTAASTLNTTDAVEALTAVVKAYPEYVNNVTAAVDKWVAVQARAPVTAADLANAMKQVGITAREIGVSLDELNGIVAAIAEVTRKSGKAIGNSLKTIFARLPRAKTVKVFRDMGLAIKQSQTEFRPFGDVLFDIVDNWEKLTDVQQKNLAQTVGGIRRYVDFVALIKNYDRFVGSLADSLLSSGDAADKAQIDMQKYSRQLQSARTAVSELTTDIGKKLNIKILLELNTQLALFAKAIQVNADSFKRVGTTVGVIGGSLLALNLIIRTGNSIIKRATLAAGTLATSYRILGASATAASVGVKALNVAISPIGIALITIVPLIYQYIKGLKNAKEAQAELREKIKGTNVELVKQEELFKLTPQQKEHLEGLRQEQKGLQELRILLDEEIKKYKDYSKVLEKVKKFAGKPLIVGVTDTKVLALASKAKQILQDLGAKNVAEGIEIVADRLKFATEEADKTVKALRETSLSINEILREPTPKHIPGVLTDFRKSLFDIETTLNRLRAGKDISLFSGEGGELVSKRLEAAKNLKKELSDLIKSAEIEKERIRLIDKRLSLSKLEIEEAEKLRKKRDELNKDLISNQAEILRLQREINFAYERAREEYKKLLEIQSQSNLRSEKAVNFLDIQITKQKAYNKGFGKLASVRAIDFSFVQKILANEKKVLDIEERKEIINAQKVYWAKEEANIRLSDKEINERNVKLEKIRLKFAKKRILLDIRALEQINKQIENIEVELGRAFASGFANLPRNIVENKRAIKEIKKEREQTEKDLALAIKENDVAAINNARRRLVELRNEMARLKPVWLDIFTNIGNIAITKWAESFADSIIAQNAGELLSSGIIPASTLGAQKMYEAIISASAIASQTKGFMGTEVKGGKLIGKFKTGDAVTERELAKLPQNLQSSADKMGNRLSAAIESGGNLAAISLVRAFGIGTSEISNSLANVGGMFGSALFKDSKVISEALGSFAGPIGVLAGSIVGGLVGSIFEKPEEKFDEVTNALDRNTQAIENNNTLLELQREFLNAPASFISPPASGFQSSGGVNVTVNINGASNPQTIASEVINIIDQAYSSTVRRSQSNFNRFGR